MRLHGYLACSLRVTNAVVRALLTTSSRCRSGSRRCGSDRSWQWQRHLVQAKQRKQRRNQRSVQSIHLAFSSISAVQQSCSMQGSIQRLGGDIVARAIASMAGAQTLACLQTKCLKPTGVCSPSHSLAHPRSTLGVHAEQEQEGAAHLMDQLAPPQEENGRGDGCNQLLRASACRALSVRRLRQFVVTCG